MHLKAGKEVLKVIEHEGANTIQGSIVACFNEKQVEELGNLLVLDSKNYVRLLWKMRT